MPKYGKAKKEQTSDHAQTGPGVGVTQSYNKTYPTGAGKGIPAHNPSGQPNSTDRGNGGKGRG